MSVLESVISIWDNYTKFFSSTPSFATAQKTRTRQARAYFSRCHEKNIKTSYSAHITHVITLQMAWWITKFTRLVKFKVIQLAYLLLHGR